MRGGQVVEPGRQQREPDAQQHDQGRAQPELVAEILDPGAEAGVHEACPGDAVAPRRRFAALALDAQRRQADDVVGRRRDADAGLVELADDVARHGVLGPADLVRADDEAHRQLHPVVGDAPVDARLEVDRLHPEGRCRCALASTAMVSGSVACRRAASTSVRST